MNIRRSKRSHAQLWLRTPTGWTSVPEAYQLPESSQYGLPQLPYPQFPPVVYYGGHQPFSQCEFPGCGRDSQYREPLPYRGRAQLEFREPRFTEVDSAFTPLSAGAPELASLPVRPLVSPQWSPQQSGTAQPTLSHAPGCASDSDTFVSLVSVHLSDVSGGIKAATGPPS